jgi:multidrug efflux pump subunit AcrA (membrane-fusion protein)
MFKEKMLTIWNTYKSSKLAWGILIVAVIIIIVVATKGSTTVSTGVATVTKGDVVDSVVLSGRTASASAVKLGFADQGRVSGVYVKEGDKVSKGQLLASIDTSDLYLDNISKITKEQDALVANAYRNLLSSGLQVIPENISNGIIAATISGIYSGPEGEYIIRVYGSGTDTGKSFEISGLENGDTQPVVTDTAVPLGSRGLFIQFQGIPDAGNWIISIPNKRATLYATYFNAYESAKATRDRVITDAQASNDAVLSRINKRKIYAPFSGTVANVGIKAGESTGSISSTDTTATGTITLISENDYEVTLKAPEISVAKLSVGQDVSLNLDAYGKDVVFPGKITSINPAETIVDGVPVYETKVSFTNKDDRIRSGMTATATIIVNQKTGVLTVPANYIHTDKDGSYVYVLIDEKTTKQAVVTGLRGSDSSVEIVSGLTEGQQVRTDAL